MCEDTINFPLQIFIVHSNQILHYLDIWQTFTGIVDTFHTLDLRRMPLGQMTKLSYCEVFDCSVNAVSRS